jgi:hypothetical protein
VKRLIAWVAGAAGGLAAYRAVLAAYRAVRGKHRRLEATPDPGADARAEELKARLQHARAAAGDTDVSEPVAATESHDAVLPDPAARRVQVHEQGRAALDEMHGDQT